MSNKVTRYIFIVIGLIVLWASTSRTAMQYISEKRGVDTWWGTDQWMHGDLASMSHLHFVDRFAPPKDQPSLRRANYAGERTTNLFLHGDSYTRHLSDTLFAGVATYKGIDRNHGTKYHLDTTKRNILVIEMAERYVRNYFANLRILDEVYDSVAKNEKLSALSTNSTEHIHLSTVVPDISVDNFFNKYINQNLECNLFNYQFMMPMFGCKAAINYYLFDRASGDVVISKDKSFLFLKETVTLSDIGSSYIPVADDEVNHLVDNFNTIYDRYKADGFTEVYLSIIPNPATIQQPEGYNNLIPRIQNNERLRMKIIDAYSAFSNSKDVLYLTGDTHWNNKGKQLWIDLVNKHLVN